ncbi:MAG: threonine ammonia-lyase [Actinobacteria bacterium]|nr:threonine ammonia-lyase [Actinomycetota bacterium]
MNAEVKPEELREAAHALRAVARRTPVVHANWLSEMFGHPVLLKCENLQRSGSFKLRGAYLRISRIPEPDRERGVVAASAGNHAQGVALAAGQLGVTSVVYMPRTASLPKVEATRAYGAEVCLVGDTVEDALAAAQAAAEETGATLIHPFDHRDVILGQATVGLEILEQVPDVASIVVPTGGGGLLAGVASAVNVVKPSVAVIAAQASGAFTMQRSLAAGHPVALQGRPTTMADGIAVARPGELPLDLVEGVVRESVAVSEAEIAKALLHTLERGKLLAEPAGVVGVAALSHLELRDPTVVVLSGGNIDPLVLNKVIHHGLRAAGRFEALSVRLDDSPGALAALLVLLAEQETNVVDVNHLRADPRLAVGEVEVTVVLEMRGPEHRAQVLAALRSAGYRVHESAGS